MIENSISLLLDDPDLTKIETRVSRFNIFEAIGAVNGELHGEVKVRRLPALPQSAAPRT